MNCKYCRSRIFDKDRNCPKCGAPIEMLAEKESISLNVGSGRNGDISVAYYCTGGGGGAGYGGGSGGSSNASSFQTFQSFRAKLTNGLRSFLEIK
jgi:hypothetical protein